MAGEPGADPPVCATSPAGAAGRGVTAAADRAPPAGAAATFGEGTVLGAGSAGTSVPVAAVAAGAAVPAAEEGRAVADPGAGGVAALAVPGTVAAVATTAGGWATPTAGGLPA
jgi:hypothetical protein